MRQRLVALAKHPLLFALYIPAVIFSTAMGVMGPVLPLYAADFGVPYGVVGLVVAAETLGTLLGDVPAGMLMPRLGKKRLMILGLGLYGTMITGLYFVRSIWAVAVLLALGGAGWAFFGVSRHAYVADSVAVAQRGRAIAVFGGTFRIGRFLGPALGGAVAGQFGLRVPFLIVGLLALGGLIFVWRFAEADDHPDQSGAAPPVRTSIRELLRAHYRTLAAAGGAQFLAQMTRAGWRTIIPLFAADVIGLDVAQIGLVISAMSAVDMALFMPTGWIMDRWGRKFAIVPSFALQAVGLALIPLTSGFASLLAVGLIIGFGNGLGAGTMMTLGADLAPPRARGEFLGVWRLIGDTGAATGPLVAGAVADVLSLPATALVAAVGGVLAALTFVRIVPETLRREARPVAGDPPQ
ncbi:MAG: MFS transporter [Anaerolineae bacterium]